MGTGCKPVGFRLRRFESFSAHAKRGPAHLRRASTFLPAQTMRPDSQLSSGDHQLHDHHVEPLAKFPPDFTFGSHDREAASLVKRYRGL